MFVTKEQITAAFVEDVEDAVGMSAPAWDCVDPKEIIAAAFNVVMYRMGPLLVESSLLAMLRSGAGEDIEHLTGFDDVGATVWSTTVEGLAKDVGDWLVRETT